MTQKYYNQHVIYFYNKNIKQITETLVINQNAFKPG